MKCQQCGTENPDTSLRCQTCGKFFVQTRKCPYCGEILPVNANFCPKCAKPQNVQPPQFTQTLAPKKKKLSAKMGVGIGIGAAVLILIFMAISSINEQKEQRGTQSSSASPASSQASSQTSTNTETEFGTIQELLENPQKYESMDVLFVAIVTDEPKEQGSSTLINAVSTEVDTQFIVLHMGDEVQLSKGDEIQVLGRMTFFNEDKNIITIQSREIEKLGKSEDIPDNENKTEQPPVVESNFDTSDYLMIDNNVLYDYGKYLIDEKICTVIAVKDIDGNMIKADCTEAEENLTYDFIFEFSSDVPDDFASEDDLLTIAGEVSKNSSSTVRVSNCVVVGLGEEADSLRENQNAQIEYCVNHKKEAIWADAFTPINDFTYKLDHVDRTITLIQYAGNDDKIMLSPTYVIDGEEYRLISLGDDACFLGETNIISIYVPEGVLEIGSSTFNSCSMLQYLYLPKSIESMDGVLGYLDEYKVIYQSQINPPASKDERNYPERDNRDTRAERIGGTFGGAINGFLGGLAGDEVITHIYYAGTEEEWDRIAQ